MKKAKIFYLLILVLLITIIRILLYFQFNLFFNTNKVEENNGYTVSLQNVEGDSHSVYLDFKIMSSLNEIPSQIGFEEIDYNLYNSGGSGYFLIEDIPDNHEKKLTAIIIRNNGLNGRPLSIELNNLIDLSDPEMLLSQGQWLFRGFLDYPIDEHVRKVKEPFPIDEHQLTLNKLYLSSYGLHLELTSVANDKIVFNDKNQFKLKAKKTNGTEEIIEVEDISFSQDSSNIILNFRFKKPINYKQIKALDINDLNIEIF